MAELRVPYSRGTPRGVHTTGPYRVEVSGARFAVAVKESEVRTGARIACCDRPGR